MVLKRVGGGGGGGAKAVPRSYLHVDSLCQVGLTQRIIILHI